MSKESRKAGDMQLDLFLTMSLKKRVLFPVPFSISQPLFYPLILVDRGAQMFQAIRKLYSRNQAGGFYRHFRVYLCEECGLLIEPFCLRRHCIDNRNVIGEDLEVLLKKIEQMVSGGFK